MGWAGGVGDGEGWRKIKGINDGLPCTKDGLRGAYKKRPQNS